MQDERPGRTQVVVVSADAAFAAATRAIFGASGAIELEVVSSSIAAASDAIELDGATVLVVDLDANRDEDIVALGRLMTRIGAWLPVIAVTQTFDASVARTLLQMRVADFLVKPVAPVDLVRACAQATSKPAASASAPTEASIYTFLPAVGGAGVTTLAVQTAMLLLNSAGPRAKASTCLVDLDFQHGAVADYLDLEPRLNLAEIEPRPDRLDRQLLEVMLSHHSSGLAVVAAPNRPAEMRSFDPDVVTRLLDLVSTNFDYVVFDMPRTWFSWTDSVLLGSNKLFIVSEATVPGLRHAKQLVAAIKERLGDGPKPQVIINRFHQRVFSSGLAMKDVGQALGDCFGTVIPNDYNLVREAIDRGVPLEDVKPGNRITSELRKIMFEPTGKAGEGKSLPLMQKLKLAVAR
jgi:pilus assembly protein CpaE